jgi:hypothetical protein
MMNRILLLCAQLALILLDVSCGASAAEAPPARSKQLEARSLPLDPYHGLTVEQLNLLLDTSDPSVLAFRVASMITDSQNPLVCKRLRSLWLDQRSSAAPIAAQGLAARTEVRIPLAATLSRCDGPEGKDAGYRAFLLSVITDERMNTENRRSAASNLGIVGNQSDITLLQGLAMKGSSTDVALGAVGGLSAMKSAAARTALLEIANAPGTEAAVRDTARRLLQE